MLSTAEKLRIDIGGQTPRSHKRAMGQFMTPAPVAAFMAGLFEIRSGPIRLLDPGAGLGALTCAALDRWRNGELGRVAITVEAHELDRQLSPHLEKTLATYTEVGATVRVKAEEYLAAAAEDFEHGRTHFTHAILNPPYKKISTSSDARTNARRFGLETVNLYSAFVGGALAHLREGGQLVAIIPRSFCNGPYYKSFRRFLLQHAALKHIHLFDSRTKAFKDDEVLQENIIVLLEKGVAQGPISISISEDERFVDMREQSVPFQSVVKPADSEFFFHIPQGMHNSPLEDSPKIASTMKELGISVSTGPVVDFRVREYLVTEPTNSSVPLLYPAHFSGSDITWPISGFKKANAIEHNESTKRWLFPSGTYTVVRRFSSKEEKRRVVASMVRPAALNNPTVIGFENHLNVFHQDRQGLPEALAWGLFVYLNSTAVDDYFRGFNGHTQVNATDLRNIKYPDRKALDALGEWAMKRREVSQTDIDGQVEALLK